MNLLSLVDQFGEVAAAPIPNLDPQRCLHSRERLNQCTACVDLCPVVAITLADGPDRLPQLDPERCRLCHACLPACPTGAFTAEDALPDLLRCSRRLNAKELELLCNHLQAADRGPAPAAIRVRGCLAGLGTAAYLALAAAGTTALTVRTDSCAGCPWAELEAHIKGQVAEARGLLALWQHPTRLALAGDADESWKERPCFRAEVPPVNRRSLARLLREEEETTVTPGTQPFHQRLRALQSLVALSGQASGVRPARLPAGAGFAMVYADEKCTACGTCQRACLTGALEVEVAGDRFHLTFAPQACVACGLCARLCPAEALVVEEGPLTTQIFGEHPIFLLHEGAARRCAHCNAPFAPQKPDARYCELCEFRRSNPFGSQVPPALLKRAFPGREPQPKEDR